MDPLLGFTFKHVTPIGGWVEGDSKGCGRGCCECKRASERRRERKGGEVVTGLQV